MFTRILLILCICSGSPFLRAEAPCCAPDTGAEAKSEVRVDNSLFDALLQSRVRDGLVDYVGLKTDTRLADYLTALEKIDPATLGRSQRLAYWINAYNAATLKLMADSWPVTSIMKINDGKPWDVPVFQPAGTPERLTLNQIEHTMIRKGFVEPRIHFALVCAAISCPPLRSEAYAGERLSVQLNDQTRSFLRNPARNSYDASAHALRLSPLFQWYAIDFGGANGTPGFVTKYLGDAERAALKRFSREPALVFGDYDWSPNAQP